MLVTAQTDLPQPVAGGDEQPCPRCEDTRSIVLGNHNDPNVRVAACPDCTEADDYDPTDVDPYDLEDGQ